MIYMAGYSKRSLAEKLGLKDGMKVAFFHDPRGYRRLLGTRLQSVTIHRRPRSEMDFIHFFTSSGRELVEQFEIMKKLLKKDGMFWVSWPKKSSGRKTDMTEDVVRAVALGHGLVDVKVCAVDEIWSGLKLVYRKKDRKKLQPRQG